MTKYNIRDNKKEPAHYTTLVNPKTMDKMRDQIFSIIVTQGKYRDKHYSAKQLAQDLMTNTRYVSAVINVKFGMNYASFVNHYRVKDAVAILSDPKHLDLRMQDISDMVGFANRQSFYAAFFKVKQIPPREFREMEMAKQRRKRESEKTA